MRFFEPRCRNGPAREYRNAEQLNYRCRSVVIEGGRSDVRGLVRSGFWGLVVVVGVVFWDGMR